VVAALARVDEAIREAADAVWSLGDDEERHTPKIAAAPASAAT
jgi:hypothetical protein